MNSPLDIDLTEPHEIPGAAAPDRPIEQIDLISLALSYDEMGDKEGAREILSSIIANPQSDEQYDRAQRMAIQLVEIVRSRGPFDSNGRWPNENWLNWERDGPSMFYIDQTGSFSMLGAVAKEYFSQKLAVPQAIEFHLKNVQAGIDIIEEVEAVRRFIGDVKIAVYVS